MQRIEMEQQNPTGKLAASIRKSLSASRWPKPKGSSPFLAKDLASLQAYLDHDYQNFWDVRRCGNSVGLLIRCAVCGVDPPKPKKGENWIWYGYRKWRWMAEHLVSKHCREAALTHRRIVAEHKRLEAKRQPS